MRLQVQELMFLLLLEELFERHIFLLLHYINLYIAKRYEDHLLHSMHYQVWSNIFNYMDIGFLNMLLLVVFALLVVLPELVGEHLRVLALFSLLPQQLFLLPQQLFLPLRQLVVQPVFFLLQLFFLPLQQLF